MSNLTDLKDENKKESASQVTLSNGALTHHGKAYTAPPAAESGAQSTAVAYSNGDGTLKPATLDIWLAHSELVKLVLSITMTLDGLTSQGDPTFGGRCGATSHLETRLLQS